MTAVLARGLELDIVQNPDCPTGQSDNDSRKFRRNRNRVAAPSPFSFGIDAWWVEL